MKQITSQNKQVVLWNRKVTIIFFKGDFIMKLKNVVAGYFAVSALMEGGIYAIGKYKPLTKIFNNSLENFEGESEQTIADYMNVKKVCETLERRIEKSTSLTNNNIPATVFRLLTNPLQLSASLIWSCIDAEGFYKFTDNIVMEFKG